MKDDLAHHRLQEILELIDEWGDLYERRWGHGYERSETPSLDGAMRARKDLVHARTRLARDIVVAMDEPELAALIEEHEEGMYGGHPFNQARTAIIEAMAILAQREELAEITGPVGPRMSASRLHPVIWGSAAALWDDGHHRAGVQTAGSALEGLLQAIAGPGASGVTLAELFSIKADAKGPRLRLRGLEPQSKSWTSAHEGAAALVRACFQSVRNSVSHPGAAELDPDQALEMIAVLSYAARLVDASDVVEPPG